MALIDNPWKNSTAEAAGITAEIRLQGEQLHAYFLYPTASI